MREFYKRYEQDFRDEEIRSAPDFITTKAAFVVAFFSFYFGPALFLPLLMFPQVLTDRRTRLLVFVGAIVILGLAVEVFFIPHYAAPLTAVTLAMVIQALRHLRVWRWNGRLSGVLLVRALPLVAAGVLAIRLAAPALGLPLTETALWWARPDSARAGARARTRPHASRGHGWPPPRHRPLWSSARLGATARVGLQPSGHSSIQYRLGEGHGRRRERGPLPRLSGPAYLADRAGPTPTQSRTPPFPARHPLQSGRPVMGSLPTAAPRRGAIPAVA